MTEPEVRRRRPAVSCSRCRKQKIRCNRESPCSNCLRSRSEACVYENPNLPHSYRTTDSGMAVMSSKSIPISRPSTTNGSPNLSQMPNLLMTNSACGSTPVSQPPVQDAELLELKIRIRQLEDQLSRATVGYVQSPLSTHNSNIETTSSRLSGTMHVHYESGSSGRPQSIARSVTHKTRLFGQSHWCVNGVLLTRDIFEAIEPHLREENSDTWAGLEKCKSLARDIKAQRIPPWPSPPTPNLPSKEVSDTLVECYLRTTEAIYRILHVPTFRRDYEALWVSNTVPDVAFLVRLKLVLAIGAVTYDQYFSLRVPAISWIHEAQIWESEPKFKSRLDLPSLQTHLLLLIAQERLGVRGDLMWISVGALLRKAVYMGLHRDPSQLPRMTTFTTEMRRRLWNTILEMTLQSSLTSGGPPFISLCDFDTAPPSNFDDDQLMADNPTPNTAAVSTQATIAIALRNTFPQRLAVVKFLNDISSSGTYKETLQLDAELRTAYKGLRRTLQTCSSSDTQSLPTPFDIRVVDLLMHRYLSSLHVPYFSLALHETVYAFSRKVVVESALTIWRSAFPPSALGPAQPSDNATTSSPNCDDLLRLVICSSGFYPSVAIQAVFNIAVELRAQLQEEDSLGPVHLRPDLLSVLDDAKTWCLRVIEAGETNVKGYLLVSFLAAQIDGLARNIGKDCIAELLIKAVQNVEEICLPILEKMASEVQGHKERPMGTLHQVSLAMPQVTVDDWGFMTSDSTFDPSNNGAMNWMFNNDLNPATPSLW